MDLVLSIVSTGLHAAHQMTHGIGQWLRLSARQTSKPQSAVQGLATEVLMMSAAVCQSIGIDAAAVLFRQCLPMLLDKGCVSLRGLRRGGRGQINVFERVVA